MVTSSVTMVTSNVTMVTSSVTMVTSSVTTSNSCGGTRIFEAKARAVIYNCSG